MSWRRMVLLGLGAGVLLLAAIQLVPYGRDHTNPPVGQEPDWPSPEVRSLAARACFDCHSNETAWPWYSSVAPVSWLVARDVSEGRHTLNFSDWSHPEEADEMAETVLEGEMPPFYYVWMHPSAALSDAEQDILVRGLQAIGGGEGEGR